MYDTMHITDDCFYWVIWYLTINKSLPKSANCPNISTPVLSFVPCIVGGEFESKPKSISWPIAAVSSGLLSSYEGGWSNVGYDTAGNDES